MNTSLLQQITLYRYRYVVAYTLVGIFLAILLLLDISSLPNGVRDREIASSVASNSLNLFALQPADVINMPYHLLQKLSISVLGLSPLSIRLPSVIIGFFACIALAIALHQWFRKNVAAIALLLAVTAVPFISMSRSGTASVLYMFLLLVMLLGASKLTVRTRHPFAWKLIVITAALLLLYMPLGVYALLALVIAGIFHPHVRYQIKKTAWWQYLIIGLLTLILLAPLMYASYTDFKTLEGLLGITDLKEKLTLTYLADSSLGILKTMLQFHKPHIADVITPFLGLTSALLVLFGLVRTIMDRHAARSYLLHLWILISIPLLILNPTSFPLLFVPCVFLMAIGLETLLSQWYEVFPRNPYARLGAFIPLSLIIIGVITVSITRYFYGFYYTDTRDAYKPELYAVTQTLEKDKKMQLIVPTDQLAFYDILRSKYPQLTVTSPETVPDYSQTFIMLASVGVDTKRPARIVTSGYKKDGVLLRVYSPNQ